jgi:hypothetical protein
MDNNSRAVLSKRSFSESESQGWCTDEPALLDPRPIEPVMTVAGHDQSWGFHPRAELLNGRLAMLGFVIGVAIEAFTGHGILDQLGLRDAFIR